MDYILAFANRVRRLRETAGLTIEEAADRGGISANSWGKVERGEQEPCLLFIGGIAQGLGISTQVLMTLEERPPDNSVRSQINHLLDLCVADQWNLILQIVKAVHAQSSSKPASPSPTAI